MAWSSYNSSGAAKTNGSPTFVTSLPTGSDGQEVYYQVDSSKGVIWHLRYRGTAAGGSATYPWEFVGGPPQFAQSTAVMSPITATSPANLSTSIATTLALKGEYFIETFSTQMALQGASRYFYLAPGFSGGMTETAAVTGGVALFSSGVDVVVSAASSYRKEITGASTVLTLKGWVVSGATGYPNNAEPAPVGMRVTPIRVG